MSEEKLAGISVIVVCHNMRREARRTLYSLSPGYQHLGSGIPIEVLVLDHGSTHPLSAADVESFGPDFRYHYVDTTNPSPCEEINRFVLKARYDRLMVLIDGARILSPGIVHLVLLAFEALPHPFIYTFGMHLGSRPQNFLVSEGYNQMIEDELLGSINWQKQGYSLFSIASPALSSKRGFFSRLSESNCFAMRKEDLIKVGMYDTRFKSPGGGLCNLELFNRLNACDWIQPVMLLGEATFHQFHGGVATNVPMEQHPWNEMEAEYQRILGEPYDTKVRAPLYLGSFREECAHLYTADRSEEL
jgi:hypothetical protein